MDARANPYSPIIASQAAEKARHPPQATRRVSNQPSPPACRQRKLATCCLAASGGEAAATAKQRFRTPFPLYSTPQQAGAPNRNEKKDKTTHIPLPFTAVYCFVSESAQTRCEPLRTRKFPPSATRPPLGKGPARIKKTATLLVREKRVDDSRKITN